jgi:hypothetical protein
MPDYCTCGAELPPDARFCHKCGKPQREADQVFGSLPEQPQQPASPMEPPLAVVSAIDFLSPSFHNPLAVRIGLLAASVGMLLTMLLQLGSAVWMVGAGFFASFLFSRRTRQQLTVRAGARIGWITGILCFVIFVVLLAIAASTGGIDEVRQQLREMPSQDPNFAAALKVLETPGGIAAFYITTLVVVFAAVTTLCTAGGALGAKILQKE